MKTILTIITTFTSLFLCAQMQRGNNWISGLNGNRIYFNATNITTYGGIYGSKYFLTGSSCTSDTLGNLVLASDGYNIYDSLGDYIDDGDTVIPIGLFNHDYGSSAYSQASIFLPMDSDIYYFITPTMSDTRFADCIANNNCHFDLLLYNVIDMKANAGAGKVVKRMVPLMENAQLRKTQMRACRHGNGKDWWLLKNEGDSGNVHTFLVTQDSIYDKGVQIFNAPDWGEWDLRGQSAFNSNGSVFATTSQGGALTQQGLIFIADFDRCYGLLSNPKVIEMPVGSEHDPLDSTKIDTQSGGLCFSPNSRFLYVSSYANIYQYDLWDSTWFHVAGLDTTYNAGWAYCTAYLAPDEKIYIGNFGGGSKQMSRIDNPDIKGAGCNFCPKCLRLDSLGAAYLGTPPCMPNYGLGAKTCWPLQSIEPTAREEDWSFYPNPVFQDIIIKDAKGKRKMLFDALGQVLLSTTKDEIDVSKYPRGLYYIRCDNKSKKVIIE